MNMPGNPEQAVSFGPFTLHRAEKVLLEAGRQVRLGERTLNLLIALVGRSGEVAGKQDLISSVWGDGAVEEATPRTHIAVLRTVLGEGQSGQRYIVNVAGRGYCFVAEARAHAHGYSAVKLAMRARVPLELIYHLLARRRLTFRNVSMAATPASGQLIEVSGHDGAFTIPTKLVRSVWKTGGIELAGQPPVFPRGLIVSMTPSSAASSGTR